MKKTLEVLQEDHSRLCAEAGDLGLSVPEDLTVDFDTAEVGATVVSNLEALIRKFRTGVDEAVADAAEEAHSETDNTPPAPRKAQAKKQPGTKAVPAKGKKAGVTTVTKTPKKVAAKKAVKTKAKKTVKKAVAKKAKTNGTGKKRAAKGDGPVAAVVAMLKSAKGCTRADILKKTGWKAVSVQQIAEGAGLKLKVSEERPFTYKAT